MTRVQADNLLSDMLPFDGASRYDRWAIMEGIHIGSRFVWDDKKKPILQKQARHDGGVVVHDHEGNVIFD